MVFKWVKRGVLLAVAIALVGGLVFGTDLISYASSTARSARKAIKDSIPTEFELRRARDLVEDIIPEMQANVRIIAEQEVELVALRADVPKSERALATERGRIERLEALLSAQQVGYEIDGREFRRVEIKEELARRFDRFKEAELVLSGKRRLLKAREESLRAAMQMLERTKAQKSLLVDKIAALEAQYRLVQAASVGSKFQVDDTKLAQAEKLIGQIKKRLDVAERVLAHEARFTESIPMETISEEDLLSRVREHFTTGKHSVAVTSAVDRPNAAGVPDRQQ